MTAILMVEQMAHAMGPYERRDDAGLIYQKT
jgi:hypothetical protein